MQGFVAPGFEPVQDAFAANFSAGEELGAGFAAYLDGELIINLMGGWCDRQNSRVWNESTLVPIYSTTKPIAALTLAHIIDKLDLGYETPVADIWAEFARNGKAEVTIGQLVSHQAGLPGFANPIDPDLWLHPEDCAKALAEQAPLWSPGTAHGYHPLTWGYLIGEVVRRIDGRSLGTILREDITEPEGIDFLIGTPVSEHDRIAEIMRPRALPDLGEINAATKAAFLTPWSSAKRGGARWREIEIPSANGHGTAQSVAQLYGLFANHGQIGTNRYISEPAFAALTASRVKGQDLVLPSETEFAAGVMLNNLGIYGPNPRTLCHSGWGGSLALGDLDIHLSAAYVMNRQSNSLQGDPRATRLVQALYDCL